MRRISRSRIALVVMLVLSAFLPLQHAATQADTPFPSLEIIFLVDESNSMWVTTDPNDWRSKAIEHFVTTLGVEQSASDYRVAAILFGSQTKVVGSGFVSLKDNATRKQWLADYQAAHKTFLNNGWTDVLAAMKEARRLLESHQTGYKPIVVILTDGVPETEAANTWKTESAQAAWPGYIQQVATYTAENFDDIGYEGNKCAVAATGTPVYPIVISTAKTAARYSDEHRALWVNLASSTNGGYKELMPQSEDEFQQKLHTIFTDLMRDWLCVYVPDTGYGPSPREEKFHVQSTHFQLWFSIAKTSPEIRVEIFDALQQPITPSQENVSRNVSTDGFSEAWSVLRPIDLSGWEGDWTVKLTGQGEVKFTPILASDYLHMSFVEPPTSILPVGSDLVIRIEILNEQGELVKPENIVSADIMVTDPNGEVLSATGEYSDQGLVARLPAPEARGRYQIKINVAVQSGTQVTTLEQTKDVELAFLPWVKVISPQWNGNYAAGALNVIETALMFQEDEYAGRPGEAHQMSAQLYREEAGSEQLVGEYLLEAPSGGTGHYLAALPSDLQPGDYELRVQLNSQIEGGQQTGHLAIIPFRIETDTLAATPIPIPTPMQIPTSVPVITPTAIAQPKAPMDIPPGVFALCGGAIVVLLVMGGLFALMKKLPKLPPLSLSDDDGNSYIPKKRRIVIVGRDGLELARLRLYPQGAGLPPEAEIEWLDEDTLVKHQGNIIDLHEPFDLRHDDLLEVGDIRLYVANPLEDIVDYGDADSDEEE